MRQHTLKKMWRSPASHRSGAYPAAGVPSSLRYAVTRQAVERVSVIKGRVERRVERPPAKKLYLYIEKIAFYKNNMQLLWKIL